ncbi:hypothetical protein ACFOHT_15520 [Massilia oculi]|uniref:Uncharacterized protein n=1 Tax=Massilia oculi TaxID=945844 RepID=A0A2S2DIP2_9BURK|nr:hypothetical protein [Massilia oculi]AWL05215.1 hypothetical protein DIR46_12790 [Massilia oculi]
MKVAIVVLIMSVAAQVAAAERKTERIGEWKGEAGLDRTLQLPLSPTVRDPHAAIRRCTALWLVISGLRAESEDEPPVHIFLGETGLGEDGQPRGVRVGTLTFYGWPEGRTGRSNLSFPVRDTGLWIGSLRQHDEMRVTFVTADRTGSHAAPSIQGISLWCRGKARQKG